jgi:hypothetical protein
MIRSGHYHVAAMLSKAWEFDPMLSEMLDDLSRVRLNAPIFGKKPEQYDMQSPGAGIMMMKHSDFCPKGARS